MTVLIYWVLSSIVDGWKSRFKQFNSYIEQLKSVYV